jgi:hypothetical protein
MAVRDKIVVHFALLCLVGAQPLTAAPVRAQEVSPRAGVQVTSSDATGIVLELATPTLTLQDEAGAAGPCRRLTVAGYAQAGAPGTPELPVQSALLGVPADTEFTVAITPLASEVVAGAGALCPAPAAGAEPDDGEAVRYVERPAAPDSALYGQDAPYPAQAATVEEAGYVRSQRVVRVTLYPFQYNPARGELLHHKRLQVRLSFAGGVTSAAAAGDEGVFEETLATTLLNYDSARLWRMPPAPEEVAPAEAEAVWRPPQPSYRVETGEEGLYVLTYAALQTAGVPVDAVLPGSFRMFNNGKEVAIRLIGAEDGTFDPGDELLFFAQAANEKYANRNAHFLTYGGTNGARMAVRSGGVSPGAAVASGYLATVRLEENSSYVSGLPMAPGYDHWYGPRITAVGRGAVGSRTFTVPTDQLAGNGSLASLTVAVGGNLEGTHHLRVRVNGTLVREITWTGRTYNQTIVNFPAAYLTDGTSQVRLELVNDAPGQEIDMVYVDWLSLTYQRKLVAQGDSLSFGSPDVGMWRYAVAGFTGNAVEVYDVTDPAAVAQISAGVAGGTATFGDSRLTLRRYLVQTAARRLTPTSITPVASGDLTQAGLGADYVIIAHRDFLAAVRPLAEYRARRGLRVQVLDVQSIYDQFNYGRMSAQAIRDFLAYAYKNWRPPAPSYVLLVGDGTYDPKGFLATSGPTFIPPYLETVDPVLGETAADNRYVAVSGNDILPDMHIGRFPADSAAEVTAMVDKTIAYEKATIQDGWNQNLVFATDDLRGGGGSFYDYSESVAEGVVASGTATVPLVPAGYTKHKFYLGNNCPVENPAVTCRQGILDQINVGALFVSYVGHGTKQYWAEEQLLGIFALPSMTNAGRLPIMLPMTCLEGFFHEAEREREAFGEAVVRSAGTGAVASWSPTGFGLASGHDYLERGFFLSVFHGQSHTVGAAATAGKLYLYANTPGNKYTDLLDTYSVFGDPALQVRVLGARPVEDTFRLYLPFTAR